MNNRPGLLRELGVLDKAGNSIRDTITFIAEIIGHDFDMKILKKALDAVVDLQPNLRIYVDESSQPFLFREISNPYIEPKLVESGDPEEWKRIAFYTMNDRFRPSLNSSLFKFTILKMKNCPLNKAYFFVKVSHVVSDGLSALILLNNILSYYTMFAGGEVREFTPVEFLPSSEELCFPNGVSEEDSVAVDRILEQLKNEKRKDKTLVWPCVPENEENIHHALYEDGTEENFLKLRSFCKRQGVTVGNVMMAAYYFATAKIGYENIKDESTITLPVTVNYKLRDRLERKSGLDHVALIYSICKLYVEFTKETTFTELMKKIQLKLYEKFQGRTAFHDILVNTIITEESEKNNPNSEDIISPYVGTDMNLSNSGAYPFNPVYKLRQGEIHVKGFRGVGSPWSPLYSHYYLGIYSVTKMNYCFIFGDEKNTEFAKEYLNFIINLIENCSKFEKMTFEDYLQLD